ncbi:MAG TPA: hypothetical protein VFE16_12350 [Candidatus Cybelea sp.]|nr:hypothetical protein [Candidatus Cybelea sp.]
MNAPAITTPADNGSQADTGDTMRALRNAQSGDLLYVTTSNRKQLYALTYPQLQLVDTIGGFAGDPFLHGLCSGPAGDVYVTDDGPKSLYLYVFKHGAKTPSRVLSAPGGFQACSVDPTTGDVAAIAIENRPAVAIYSKGKGSPKLYDANHGYSGSAYSSNGNLYLISFDGCLTLFVKGTFTCVKLRRSARIPHAAGLQWHNGVLVIAGRAHHNQQTIYTVKLTGATTGRLVSTMALDRAKDEGPRSGLPALLAGDELMAPSHAKGLLSFWLYPKGGEPLKSVTLKVDGFVSGLALSHRS